MSEDCKGKVEGWDKSIKVKLWMGGMNEGLHS